MSNADDDSAANDEALLWENLPERIDNEVS